MIESLRIDTRGISIISTYYLPLEPPRALPLLFYLYEGGKKKWKKQRKIMLNSPFIDL